MITSLLLILWTLIGCARAFGEEPGSRSLYAKASLRQRVLLAVLCGPIVAVYAIIHGLWCLCA